MRTRLASSLSLGCFSLALAGCPTDDDDDSSSGASTDPGSTSAPGDGSGAGSESDSGSGSGSGSGSAADSGSTGASGGSSTAAADDTTAGGSESGDGSDTGGSESGGAIDCLPPQEIGSFEPPDGDARGFAVDGDTVYLAVAAAGLAIVDITDPSAPAWLGGVDFDIGELAQRVAYADGHAYVGQFGAGFRIVDVGDPADPMPLVEDDDDDANGIAVAGTVLLVFDADGVRTYDVGDPATPQVLSPQVTLPGAFVDMTVDGDHAYVANIAPGFVAVDVSDPSAPDVQGEWDAPESTNAVAAAGTLAYVAHDAGVAILDVSDPETPMELGTYVRDNAFELAIDGDTLYVLGNDTTGAGVPTLAIVDVSDPAVPVELEASLDDYADPVEIVVHAGLVLLTVEDDDSLHVIDPCPR